jgi:hypothetical protein
MEHPELRRRVGAILAAEEEKPRNWAEVERLSDDLLQQLMPESGAHCPEIVSHYLDDADIRSADEVYGNQQRERIRHFVETGEYDDGTTVSPWACTVVIALILAGIAWLIWR